MKRWVSLTIVTASFLIVLRLAAPESTCAESDMLLAITWKDSLLVSFDPYAGVVSEVHTQLNPNESFRGLAYDPNRNMLYALSQVALNLYAIDPVTLDVQHIGNLRIPCGAFDIGGLTYDPKGDRFYITLSDIPGYSSDLLTVNVETAAVNRVGGITNGYSFSPSFNSDDGKIYAFALYGSGNWESPFKSRVITINPDDMVMTALFETPYHAIMGMVKKPDKTVFYSWINWTTHFFGRINPETESITGLGMSDSVGAASDAMIFKDFYVGSGSLLPTEEKPVTFEFTGRVTEVSDPHNLLKKGVAAGDEISGTFTHDVNAVYLRLPDPASYDLTLGIGNRRFSFSGFLPEVKNNYYDCRSGTIYDAFHINSERGDDLFESVCLSMTLIDYSSASLKDNIFLPGQFDISAWDEKDLFLFSSDPSDKSSGFTIRGVLENIISDMDSDGDGMPDHSDNCPDDPKKTEPGICGCGSADSERDSDGDGTWDCKDACPDDPGKIVPGICGCGVPDIDRDGDGLMDCYDDCPNDPNKAAPGACGCGKLDIDSDGDGISDCVDRCPEDPGKTEPGICGCGLPDADADGDGTVDCLDVNGDGDGLPDDEEQGPDGGDPEYDGNHDGEPDRLQDNVVSFHVWKDAGYITLASSSGTSITDFTVSENPSPAEMPQGFIFSYKFFHSLFEGVSPGGDLTVRLYLPEGNLFHTYYKYGPTPDHTNAHWYEFLYDGQTGAEMGEGIITIHFVDGMRGDDDLSVNGRIVDTGGPGLLMDSGGEGGGGCFLSTPN